MVAQVVPLSARWVNRKLLHLPYLGRRNNILCGGAAQTLFAAAPQKKTLKVFSEGLCGFAAQDIVAPAQEWTGEMVFMSTYRGDRGIAVGRVSAQGAEKGQGSARIADKCQAYL